MKNRKIKGVLRFALDKLSRDVDIAQKPTACLYSFIYLKRNWQMSFCGQA
jgi:hypothetical protein